MKSNELVHYWVESSDRDYESMMKNYETKQYTWALFIGHLVLEKLLKALYAQNNANSPYAPKIHNLNLLAEKAGLTPTDKQSKILLTCNSFNISTRYEDYRNDFYNKCTEEYTKSQIENIKEIRKWLKQELTQKS